MTDSLETSEADALPWAPASRTPQLLSAAAELTGSDTSSRLRRELLVLAALLHESLQIIKNVEAEGGDEAELLQHLITQGEAAVAAVLQEHAAGSVRHG